MTTSPSAFSQLIRSWPWPAAFTVGVLLLIVVPEAVQAAPLSDTITQSTEMVGAWNFFRSLVNWVLVGGLILVAFANVLRISIDTYAVKKVLPTLLVAFILANFSLLISTALLDVADSLQVTVIGLAKQVAGGDTLGDFGVFKLLGYRILKAIFLPATDWTEWLKQGAGNLTVAGLGIGGASVSIVSYLGLGTSLIGPVALIVTLVLLALILLAPLLILLALTVMLIFRDYIVEVLVILGPVALIGMAFPFTRSLFQKWLNLLLTWSFMPVVAYSLLSLAVIVLEFSAK